MNQSIQLKQLCDFIKRNANLTLAHHSIVFALFRFCYKKLCIVNAHHFWQRRIGPAVSVEPGQQHN